MFYRKWIVAKQLKPTECFGDGHWESFNQARNKHNENICLKTNELVLTLDKLINNEVGQKPDLDKSLVEWTPDDLVVLCPYCANAFTFARRRHHCRVCGAILCNHCSKFLEYKAACKLVKPAKLYTDPFDRIEERLQDKDAEEKPKIRTCEDCKGLLDKRIQTIEDHYSQPTFQEFYEKLRKNMAEADELIISHSSLLSKNSQQTPELKNKIQHMKETIVSMSSKLGKMVTRETGKQAYLLGAINQSVGFWLKESVEAKLNRTRGVPKASESGWSPDQPVCSAEINEDEDPILIQIKNLEKYIEQARNADRYEEVSALEESKRELELAYLIAPIEKDLTI